MTKRWFMCALLLFPFCVAAQDETQAEPNPMDGRPIVEIEIRGLQRHSEKEVLALLKTRVGREFDSQIWNEDWCRLKATCYFSKLRMTPPMCFPGSFKLVISVVENP